MPLFADDNWFIDPFTGTLTPRAKTETHTVEQFLSFGNRYGIQTDYTILFENPSSVSIAGYTEVGFATPPSAGQFRVDYDPLRTDGTSIITIRYKNTGFIEFPASANGQSVTVNYKATGRVVKAQGFAAILANTTIPGNLNVQSLFTVEGNFEVEGNARYDLPTNIPLESAGNQTLDCSISSIFRKTGGTATVTLSNLGEGQVVLLILESTGSAYTITWAGYTFRWVNALIPEPSAISSRFDLFSFRRINGIVYASRVGVYG